MSARIYPGIGRVTSAKQKYHHGDLRSALLRLRSGELEGEGFYPQSFVINERLWLLAEPRWLQDWDQTP